MISEPIKIQFKKKTTSETTLSESDSASEDVSEDGTIKGCENTFKDFMKKKMGEIEKVSD
jgi:hypothetical protein